MDLVSRRSLPRTPLLIGLKDWETIILSGQNNARSSSTWTVAVWEACSSSRRRSTWEVPQEMESRAGPRTPPWCLPSPAPSCPRSLRGGLILTRSGRPAMSWMYTCSLITRLVTPRWKDFSQYLYSQKLFLYGRGGRVDILQDGGDWVWPAVLEERRDGSFSVGPACSAHLSFISCYVLKYSNVYVWSTRVAPWVWILTCVQHSIVSLSPVSRGASGITKQQHASWYYHVRNTSDFSDT